MKEAKILLEQAADSGDSKAKETLEFMEKNGL